MHNAGRWCTTWLCATAVVHNVGFTNPGRQMDRHTRGTDSITSTVDEGGKNDETMRSRMINDLKINMSPFFPAAI